ncbi:non-specific serine/threonine protein kinase [Plakobranchus ocellatus]|uniref:non-specific serine/threonine protein kinase n=1 Tax=Plakobranchus ocellatus TaxID=259542 RepID=A0AAV3ZTS8_9GAST|nr:non-specific serine/threonine protein kinase [Plakobranchus ocellatus]
MECKPTPFVEGWEFVQTLGEGAYGEVKLAVCSATMECVAVKIINVVDASVEEQVRKEICIHKMLDHKNVIKFYGYRKAEQIHYLFLKYASGGELFDRIEPDVGMKGSEALRLFHQLIEGVEYLHSKGVCHRDLKPENLLLDENDDLQITDFGMATVFRYQGQERELSRMCGTKPYTAPEVFKYVPYKAEPADIWSCGIILVALLSGELPWDAPTSKDRLFLAWKERCITTSPWNKIDNLALSLFRSVLVENPSRRYTLAQIKKHQFYNKTFPLKEEVENSLAAAAAGSPSSAVKRPKLTMMDDFGRLSSPPNGVTSSQPERFGAGENSLSPLAEVRHPMSFSQPVQLDDLLLNSQIPCTPGTSQTPFQKLVKRMTRFFVHTKRQETVKEMEKLLRTQGYRVKKNSSVGLTLTTVDKRKAPLIFKVSFIEMAGNILVEFRLSKGDGLEFKRHFVRIKNKLQHIIRKTAPSWPVGTSGDAEASADQDKPPVSEDVVESVACLKTDDAGQSSSSGDKKNPPPGSSVSSPSAIAKSLAAVSVKSSRDLASEEGVKSRGKIGGSKRTLEEGDEQKTIKRKATARPGAKVSAQVTTAGAAAQENPVVKEQPRGLAETTMDGNSGVGIRQQVNGEMDKLKEYMKTARDSYYGLHRSTTM